MNAGKLGRSVEKEAEQVKVGTGEGSMGMGPGEVCRCRCIVYVKRGQKNISYVGADESITDDGTCRWARRAASQPATYHYITLGGQCRVRFVSLFYSMYYSLRACLIEHYYCIYMLCCLHN